MHTIVSPLTQNSPGSMLQTKYLFLVVVLANHISKLHNRENRFWPNFLRLKEIVSKYESISYKLSKEIKVLKTSENL